MTKASPIGDNMRALAVGLVEENDLTFDQILFTLELITTGRKEEAIMLLIEMLGRKKGLSKSLDKLKLLDITAAKMLLTELTGDEQ